MKFYYIEKKIRDASLASFLNLDKFSKISFMRSSFKKIIIESLPKNFELIIVKEDELFKSKDDLNGIFWCSNIIFTNDSIQKLFLKKIIKSMFPIIFGNTGSYIFKGSLYELKLFFNNKSNNQLITLNNEIHLRTISKITDFKNLISDNSHTRHFNEISSDKENFIKKSTSINKLESEFNFLNNIPHDLKKYYVKVFEFNKYKKYAMYSMEKLPGIDLSISLINGSLSESEIQNILNILEGYFNELTNHKNQNNDNSLNFILQKNLLRHEELKNWDSYEKLDKFINSHTPFSGLDEIFTSINSFLKKSTLIFNKSNTYFSHGDLCFSNMVLSEDKGSITFIDPRGGKGVEAYRTPYYDLAKLSHSLIGGYDFIINNVAKIHFDNKMQASIDFNGALENNNHELFKNFTNSLRYDMTIVRLVEASLFASMLPLHTDDEKKVFMLAIRASEILTLLSKKGI